MDKRQLLLTALPGVAYALIFDHAGGVTDVGLLLAVTLVVAAACARLWPLAGGDATALSPVHAVLAAYVLWLFVLVYTSTLAENSIQFGWRLASFAFVFFVAFGFQQRGWLFTLLLFGLAGAASAIWGIAEFATTGMRANGPVVDPSTWGAMQNLFFFATVAVFLTAPLDRGWQRYLVAAALVLFAVAVFSAYSRVGSFIFWVALAFVIAATLRFRPLRKKLAVLVTISVLSFAAVNLYSTPTDATEHTEGFTLDVESFGWSQRLLMWESAWEIYREHAVFGTGPGTFKLHYPRFRSADELRNSGNFVHNDYLQFLVEGGPVLLAFLLALVGWLLWRLGAGTVRLARGDRQPLEVVLLIVAMGTPLTHALMNFPLYQLQIQMLLGLLFARLVMLESPARQIQLEVARPRLNHAALVFVAVFALLPAALDVVSHDLVIDADDVPLVHRLGDETDSYLGTMSLLTSLRSRNAMNHFGMATVYRTTFDTVSDPEAKRSLGITAALEYQRGLELNPWHGQARGYFAEFLEQNGWLQEFAAVEWTPESLYRDGVRRSPSKVKPYLDLADYLARQGREDEAYGLLVERALPWANHRYDGWRQARLDLARRVLRGAIARNDRAALERLLARLWR